MATAGGEVTGLPTCCGQTIPKSLVEEVGGLKQEQYIGGLYTSSAMPSTNATTARPSLPRIQTQLQTSKQRHRTLSDEFSLLAVQESYMNLARALELSDFLSMRETQVQQRDRFLAWETKLQNEIRAVHAQRKEEVHSRVDEQRDTLEEQVWSTCIYNGLRTDRVSAHGNTRRC